VQAACEGSAFGCPATAATAAFERVRAQGGEPELVDALTEAVQGLADSEAKAAGAACETVELGVELGELGVLVGARGEVGEPGGEARNSVGRGSWAELSELDVLGGWRSWDLRAGTPYDY